MDFDWKNLLKEVGPAALSFIPGVGPVLGGIARIATTVGGDSGSKLQEGLQTITQGLAEAGKQPLSPEQQTELNKVKLETEVELKQLAFEEKKLDYTDAEGGRDVIKTALLSDDPIVRQARPKMLMRLGNSCIVFVFFTPTLIGVAGYLNLRAAVLEDMVSVITWVGGFLFSSFMTSFTGYTVARTVDKKVAAGEPVSKITDMLASWGKRVS